MKVEILGFEEMEDLTNELNYHEMVKQAQKLGYAQYGTFGQYFIKKEMLDQLIAEAREAIADYDGEEELEYNWLEGNGTEEYPEEYVINVGTIVIADGFKPLKGCKEEEEIAEALYHELWQYV